MMNNGSFCSLSQEELYEIDGGSITVAIYVTLFCAGFAGGIACGLNRKNR